MGVDGAGRLCQVHAIPQREAWDELDVTETQQGHRSNEWVMRADALASGQHSYQEYCLDLIVGTPFAGTLGARQLMPIRL
jgi:hypothetical protein